VIARPGTARLEMMAGSILVVAVVVGGVALHYWTGPNGVDDLVWHVIPSGWHANAPVYAWIIRYRTPPLAVGVAVLFLVTIGRDRSRALACLIGPVLALVVSELAIKPTVGRTLGGSFSYPSGSVVSASALAMAAVLATPPRLRFVTAPFAMAYLILMIVAVVATGSHFPTDALAGLAFGAGVVLVTDGILASLLPAKGSDYTDSESPA
jgi:membrane-associated phospholipid phosphatase